jgi:hypothetical protein
MFTVRSPGWGRPLVVGRGAGGSCPIGRGESGLTAREWGDHLVDAHGYDPPAGHWVARCLEDGQTLVFGDPPADPAGPTVHRWYEWR